MSKTIHVRYFTVLREERGIDKETIETSAETAHEFYLQLRELFHFKLTPDFLRVAINNEFRDWNQPLKDGDNIVFIPPVAGG